MDIMDTFFPEISIGPSIHEDLLFEGIKGVGVSLILNESLPISAAATNALPPTWLHSDDFDVDMVTGIDDSAPAQPVPPMDTTLVAEAESALSVNQANVTDGPGRNRSSTSSTTVEPEPPRDNGPPQGQRILPRPANDQTLDVDHLIDGDISMKSSNYRPSIPRGKPVGQRYARPQDWEHFRLTITDLYSHQRKPLKEVILLMEQGHQFYATEKMYKARFQKWGLDKKLRGSEVAQMLQIKQQREMLGKKSKFIIRNRPIEWSDVDRYLQRSTSLIAKVSATGVLELGNASLGIVCRTPSPDPSIADVPAVIHPAGETQLLEETMHIVRNYYLGSAQQWKIKCGIDDDASGGFLSSDEEMRVNDFCAWINELLSLQVEGHLDVRSSSLWDNGRIHDLAQDLDFSLIIGIVSAIIFCCNQDSPFSWQGSRSIWYMAVASLASAHCQIHGHLHLTIRLWRQVGLLISDSYSRAAWVALGAMASTSLEEILDGSPRRRFSILMRGLQGALPGSSDWTFCEAKAIQFIDKLPPPAEKLEYELLFEMTKASCYRSWWLLDSMKNSLDMMQSYLDEVTTLDYQLVKAFREDHAEMLASWLEETNQLPEAIELLIGLIQESWGRQQSREVVTLTYARRLSRVYGKLGDAESTELAMAMGLLKRSMQELGLSVGASAGH